MRFTERFEKSILTISRIIYKIREVEKIPMDFGSGEKLHSSEIHTITYIGLQPDINVTNLANAMGVTKGAISQLINKLEKKKLVERHRNPTNNKEILLHLTKKGEIDYHGHEAYHAKYDAEWYEMMEKFSPEQIQFLENFLEKIDTALDRQLLQLSEKNKGKA
jgi:DNA-binding MarR family transcriptional regulator